MDNAIDMNVGPEPERTPQVSEEMVRRWVSGEEAVPVDVMAAVCQLLINKRVSELRSLPLDALLAEVGDGPVAPEIQVLVEDMGGGEAEINRVQRLTLKGFVAQLRRDARIPEEVEAWLVNTAIDHEERRLGFLSIESLLMQFQR